MTKQEMIREGIIKSLNEFRRELQKPSTLINVDTLVMLQGAFADKIMADESRQVGLHNNNSAPHLATK